MTYPHDPVSFPTDPHPVRPGTSDALFARTIDATPQPPLVQAQETVAALIPRVTASLSDPLLMATLAGTLALVWLAVRMRSRMGPVLLAAMLMVTLTSFHPVGSPDEAQIVDDVIAEEDDERPRRFERRHAAPRFPEPPPFALRVPTHPDEVTAIVERIMQDEELRAAIEDLRLRIEAELRRRGEHGDYHVHSPRWVRRLPPSLREWIVVSQRAVAARNQDP